MISFPLQCGVYPPIVTLTLNPSVDVSYTVASLVPDVKLHASAYRYDPGGNGINIARALGRLQVPAHACFVAAGEIGTLLERLLARDVEHAHCTRIGGETRINVTVEALQPDAQQFEVIGIGPELGARALEAVLQEVRDRAGAGFAALTGSVPPGVDESTYARLARELCAQQASVILDMQGRALELALQEQPFLIKPNRFELEQLLGRRLPETEDVRREAAALQASGVAHVCVSLGGEGAVLAAPDGVYHGSAPPVQVQSTVGAGDSMLAGLIAGFAADCCAADALRLGLACGSGTAAQPGTELFDPAQIQTLLRQVEVRRL